MEDPGEEEVVQYMSICFLYHSELIEEYQSRRLGS